jgi:membrane protein YdbS with pleckstrin-like domain
MAAKIKTPLMAASTGEDAEHVLWEGQFSKLAMIGEWIVGIVATLAAVIVGAVVGLEAATWWWVGGAIAVLWLVLVARLLYKQLSIRYHLTNQRFIHERGLLWRTIDRIEVIDIDDIAVDQGPVERMLGIGTVRIKSSDASTPEFYVQGIENVRGVATQIDDARRKERRKRGVYVEQV